MKMVMLYPRWMLCRAGQLTSEKRMRLGRMHFVRKFRAPSTKAVSPQAGVVIRSSLCIALAVPRTLFSCPCELASPYPVYGECLGTSDSCPSSAARANTFRRS